MNKRSGMTLVEVIVAVLILAVGVLGAFGLQATALRASSTAASVQEAANVAQSELHIQSEFRRTSGSVVTGESCRTGVPSGYGCTVTAYPCSGTAYQIACTSNNVTDVAAHELVVMVTAPGGRTYRLATIVKVN